MFTGARDEQEQEPELGQEGGESVRERGTWAAVL